MKNGNWIFWAIGGGSLVLMGFTLYYNYTYATGLACDQQGIFGDMFGASNAFFTGLSFTGVIIAILLQRQELRFQREELELTRNEMVRTRNEFELQNETLKIQRFENTFFEMLSLFNSIVNTINVKDDNNEIVTGRKAINFILSKLEFSTRTYTKGAEYLKRSEGLTMNTPLHKRLEQLNLNDIQLIYHDIYDDYNDILGHYFRTFYHIIKLIEFSDIRDKKRYISIARAQLSNTEQLLLFYNCLHRNGNEKFKPLVEKYALLNNLDHNHLLSEHIASFYKPEAYGED